MASLEERSQLSTAWIPLSPCLDALWIWPLLTVALIYEGAVLVSVVWLAPPAGILCLVDFLCLSQHLAEACEWVPCFLKQGRDCAAVSFDC